MIQPIHISISICSMMLNNKYGECGDKDNYLQSNTPLTLSGDKFPPSQLLHKLVRKCWHGHCMGRTVPLMFLIICLTYVVSPSFQLVFTFAPLQFIDSTIGYFVCTIVNHWLWRLYRWKPIWTLMPNPWASNDGFSSRFQISELNRKDPQSTGYTGTLTTQ